MERKAEVFSVMAYFDNGADLLLAAVGLDRTWKVPHRQQLLVQSTLLLLRVVRHLQLIYL